MYTQSLHAHKNLKMYAHNKVIEEAFIAKLFWDAIAGNAVQALKEAKFALVSASSSDSNGGTGGWGKDPSLAPCTFSISPNDAMADALELENKRLQDVAIFFAITNVDKCPSRKFLDDWMKNVWIKKLDFNFSFCTMIQKGLFVIFFKDNKSQLEVLQKTILGRWSNNLQGPKMVFWCS